jgi:hypothetical protein
MLDKLVNLYKKNCNVQSSIKKYIKHNKKFFSISKETYSHELFLVEFNHWQVIHVMNSYLINASRIHPHVDYNFSITPKSIIDYKNILLNLHKIKNKIDKKQLYEFHFAKNYSSKSSILEVDINKIYELKKKNKRNLGFSSNFYNFWLNNFSIKKHKRIKDNFSNFIDSKDYVSTFYNSNN